jgi:tetratricopeptide (TPR) repeat protein
MKKADIEELLLLEDAWYDREETDESAQWLEEGIELYKKLIEADKKEQRFAIMLADLYLQSGRDKKMRLGNRHAAYSVLRLATKYAPDKPDAFYHLSFIFAEEKRQWEVVLFYGKEALEKGIAGNERIKLLCNLALAYTRLGYIAQGRAYILQARNLDVQNEHTWFIQLYEDKMKQRNQEPILLGESHSERIRSTRHNREELKEAAMNGTCIVLDLTEDEKYLYGVNDAVRLPRIEALVLGYLIENGAATKEQIEKAVWIDNVVGSSKVKRNVSALRTKILQATGKSEVPCLPYKDGQYKWLSPLKSIVLR